MKIKRLLLNTLVFYFLLLSFSNELLAAPSGGTRFPAQKQFEVGYEGNVLYRRNLNRSYGVLKSADQFFTLSLGVFDWLVLDGKIGLGDITQKGGIHLPKIEYNTGFAGGYGFRVKAYDNKDWGIRAIVGAQHISVHPQDRSINDEKFESFLDDWQVSGLVAKSFKFITLYTGIKLSDCEIVYNINKHDKKRRYSKDHLGLITGGEIYLFEDKLRINGEARFFDETAFSFAISYLL